LPEAQAETADAEGAGQERGLGFENAPWLEPHLPR